MMQEWKGEQVSSRHWVGVDWGEYRHAVSVVNDERGVVTRFVVDATPEGLNTLAKRLEDVGSIAGIAIEASPSLLVAFLMSKGFALYPVNPKLSKNWREGNSVAGVKSDERDGYVLAVELARRHESLRTLKPCAAVVAELAGLCETVRSLVNERTALLQRLKAVLRQYYPAALVFFGDWSSPVAWRFLKRFPRPESLAHVRKETLCRFLKANQVGLSPRWLERIERAGAATDWPVSPNSFALETMTLALVAQLQALQPHIDRCDRLIAARCETLPQARLLNSLPGAGERLAPALTAITLLAADEEDSYWAMRCLSGVAPVQDESGKRKHTRMRRRCNKHWRNVLHLYARMSIQSCRWARAFYDLCRERGDKYATALRKLADKWVKIIHCMLEENQTYDDGRYVDALRRTRSPIYSKLCGQTGG